MESFALSSRTLFNKSLVVLGIGFLSACGPGADESGLPQPPGELANLPEYVQQPILQLDRKARRTPVSDSAWIELAKTYHANGFLDDAETVYRRMDEAGIAGPEVHHLLGCLLTERGKLEEGIEAFEKALRQVPDYGPAWLKLGDALLKTRRYEEARSALQRSLEEGASAPHAQLALGRVALGLNDDETAISHLVESIQADPRATAAHHVIAAIYRRQGRAEEADRHRREAAGFSRYRDPADPWLERLEARILKPDRLVVMADTAQQLGEYRRARNLCDRALELDADHLRARILLAEIYMTQGNPAASLREAREAVRIDPSDAQAQLSMGIALNATGDRRRAIDAFKRSIQLSPGYFFAKTALAETYHEMGRLEDAEQAYQAALDENPHATNVLTNFGVLRVDQERPSEALQLFLRSLELAPFDARTNLLASHLLARQNRLAEAEPLLRRAHLANPENREVTDFFARVMTGRGNELLQQNRRNDALAAFREALALAHRAGNRDLAAGIEDFFEREGL